MRVLGGRPEGWNAPTLVGRCAERRVLDELVGAVRDAGESRALVVHGENGVGKTALVEYLAGHARGCRVARAVGSESEMELAFAGLHQLCAPMLDRLEVLPSPQRDALRVAFGVSPGPPPDRFLIGLAVLSLLSAVAERQPLICLIDDAQWLDHTSAQILAFVARRLGAESVGLVFAARVPGSDLAGLPELAVRGLPEAEARALLDSVLNGPIDQRVRDQIMAETRGNPLALLELPRGLTPAELAGGFGLPGAVPLAGSVEESFQRRVGSLPAPSRRLLLLAAADPTGDPALVWRAADRLGIGADAAAPAVDTGLVEFGTRIRFRHPLARSAAYRSAPARDRQDVHRALAEATDGELDPDRRAWHRAQAASGPDEEIAAELERSAGRARARGGPAAAAAFLKESATLTLDPVRRADRALTAAQAEIQAGGFDAAQDLLAVAESGPLGEFERARADLVRAWLAFAAGRGGEAPALMLAAAGLLEPVDAELARATYLDALGLALHAGRLAGPGGDVPTVARAAGAVASPRTPGAIDLLLEGLAANVNQGYAAGVPALRKALSAFASGMPPEQEVRWLSLAFAVALDLWDDERWDLLTGKYVRLARDLGALTELPYAVDSRTFLFLFTGDLPAASALVEEVRAATEAMGSRLVSFGALAVAAFRGVESEVAVADIEARGEGVGMTAVAWTRAVLANGLGQYDKALEAARQAAENPWQLAFLNWALVELVEAAARSGDMETAEDAYRRLNERTAASGTDWALGIDARANALLSEGATAELLYREAIAHLGKTRLRIDLARAHLLYGEWLRRERRRVDAREQLRTAHGMFDAMGVDAFAARARQELRATGEATRKRSPAARDEELTAQEAVIARLARDGLSNPEIGTRLFISAHTVQYHLRKVFAKLGITSRVQLDRVMPRDRPTFP